MRAPQSFSLEKGWCRHGAALFKSSQGPQHKQKIKGDWIMAKNAKPVKGKKTGNVKPLMKRADLPGVKPLIRFQ